MFLCLQFCCVASFITDSCVKTGNFFALYQHALILCDNLLESLPECICCLRRLECLQLHSNHLTTIPYDLIHLESLSELSLRDNPLVVRLATNVPGHAGFRVITSPPPSLRIPL